MKIGDSLKKKNNKLEQENKKQKTKKKRREEGRSKIIEMVQCRGSISPILTNYHDIRAI